MLRDAEGAVLSEAPVDWPGAAALLLQRLRVDLAESLPYAAQDVTALDYFVPENNGEGLKLWIDRTTFIEVWFASKRAATVWVVVSLASKHKKKDPVFRAAVRAIQEQGDLDAGSGWSFSPTRERLSFEASKRFEVNELTSARVVGEAEAATIWLAERVARHHPNAQPAAQH